jgi:hypothetical protein
MSRAFALRSRLFIRICNGFCKMVFEGPWGSIGVVWDCSVDLPRFAFFHQFVTDISVTGFDFQFGVNTEKSQARLRLKAGYAS